MVSSRLLVRNLLSVQFNESRTIDAALLTGLLWTFLHVIYQPETMKMIVDDFSTSNRIRKVLILVRRINTLRIRLKF